VGFVVQSADTPLGNPETDNATLPVKPYSSVTETYDEPEPPCPTVKLPPDDNKKAGAITFSVIDVEAVNAPDVPVIVTVLCPTGVVLLAVKVSMDVLVAGFVKNVAVTPAGRFVAASVTLPEKPFSGYTST
jgi:hypothetical protein